MYSGLVMDSCCDIRPVEARQRRVLRVVLWINAVMFVTELGAGIAGHSTALLADGADMLGDAIVYGFSLYVVGRGAVWQARGALVKGAIMGVFAVGIALEIVLKLARGVTPGADVMSVVGILALAANSTVLAVLWQHRGDDLNMRSVWLCSRNDVVANVAVLFAALGVGLTGTAWPDIIVGLAIAALFATSAGSVIRVAMRSAF
jgi:Co/Zn/Cd efflux system component